MWTRLEIAGKSADVFDPPDVVRPRFGLLFLHDQDGESLRESAIYTRLLHEGKLACVCPQAGQSWWTDRVCPEFDAQVTAERHVLESVLPFLRERWGLAPQGIGLLGIGMGGQGALRLAFKHPRLFPTVAGISSALDYHDLYGRGTALDEMYDCKEQCRQDTALLHVHPAHFSPHIVFCIDPEDRAWYRGNDRLHEKMTALGIAHEIDFTTRMGGHSWPYFEHMAERAIRFLRSGWEQEGRRLL